MMIKEAGVLSVSMFLLSAGINLAEWGTFIVSVVGAISGGYALIKQAKIKAERSVDDIRIKALEGAINIHNETIDGLRKRIDELEAENDSLNKRIEAYEKEIMEKDKIISELQKKLKDNI